MTERTPRLRGRAAVAQRKRRMERTNWRCEHCLKRGIVRVATVVDHIRALANGGDDSDENTQNLCGPCHLKKTAQDFGHRIKPTIGLDGWPVED